MPNLKTLNEQLAYHFKCLADRRIGQPTFLIEHGLESDALEELTSKVTEALRIHELRRSTYWTERRRPLLVLAAEVGYKYEGTGTNYWPNFTKMVGRKLSHEERQVLSSYFEATQVETGVARASSSWANRFHHIAWPIRHALLPQWLHARLLEGITTAVSPGLWGRSRRLSLRYLRRWTGLDVRLKHLHDLLENEQLSVEVIGAILNLDEQHIGSGSLRLEGRFRARLARDVMATAELAESAAQASAQLVRGSVTGQSPGAGGKKVGTIRGARHRVPPLEKASKQLLPLHLLLGPGAPRPAVRLPRALLAPVDVQKGGRLRLLGDRRWRPLRELAAGWLTPVTLPDDACEQGTLSLVSQLPAQLPERVQAILSGLKVEVSERMLFHAADDDSDEALLQIAPVFTGSGRWWCTTQEEVPVGLPGVRKVGTLAGLSLVRIDTQQPEGIRWLQELALRLREEHSFRWLLSPALPALQSGTIQMPLGDAVFRCHRGSEQSIRESTANGSGGSRLLAECKDSHFLRRVDTSQLGVRSLEALDGRVIAQLEIVPQPKEPPAALAWLTLVGEPTLEALRGGRLAVRVESALPLLGTQVTLDFQAEGGTVWRGKSDPLPPLPVTLRSGEGVWQRLLAGMEELNCVRARLRASIPGLAEQSWLLESSLWSDERPHEVRSTHVVSDSCWQLSPTNPVGLGTSMGEGADIRLEQPVGPLGVPILGLGRVTAPKCLSLGALEVQEPVRFLRRLSGKGGVSAQALLYGWLAWSTAEAEHRLADTARRQVARTLDGWLTRLLCGEEWYKLELKAKNQRADELLPRFCRRLLERDLVREEGLWEALKAAGSDPLASISRELRAHWSQQVGCLVAVGELAELGDEEDPFDRFLLDTLNAAFQSAGRSAACLPEEDVDVAFETQEVFRLLGQEVRFWREAPTLPTLQRLIIPEATASMLQELDYENARADELAFDLGSWLKQRPAVHFKWEQPQLTALLTAWLVPALVDYEWLGGLKQLLADRGAACALRYVVLRSRLAREGSQ